MSNSEQWRALAACGVALAMLAGCGGGGSGDGGTPVTPPPPSTSGTLDPSFASGGKTVLDRANLSFNDSVTAMATDAGGNLFLVGKSVGANGFITTVMKLDNTGKSSTAFGTGGKFELATEPGIGLAATAIVLDPAGAVYVAGCSRNNVNSQSQLMVFKLDAKGALATEFGSAGRFSPDNNAFTDGCDQNAGKTNLLRDQANNFYVIGSSIPKVTQDNFIAVTKFDASGKPVTNYGVGGKQTVKFSSGSSGGSNEQARDSRLDSSGNLYVAGGSTAYTKEANVYSILSANLAVAKLDANGNPVSTFGTGGRVVVDLGSNATARSLAIDKSGNLYLAGSLNTDSTTTPAIIKLDAKGSLAADFGTGGKKIGGFASNQIGTFQAIALDEKENIYLAGSSYPDIVLSCPSDFAVAKLDPRGNVQTNFGTAGVAMVGFGDNSRDFVSAMALDNNGHIYLGGISSYDPATGVAYCSTRGYFESERFAVVRLLQ